MAPIRWTEESHRWLRDIYAHIAADNPVAAEQVVLGIYKKVQILQTFSRYRTQISS